MPNPTVPPDVRRLADQLAQPRPMRRGSVSERYAKCRFVTGVVDTATLQSTAPRQTTHAGSHRQAEFPSGLFLRAVHRDESIEPLASMKPERRSQMCEVKRSFPSLLAEQDTDRRTCRDTTDGVLEPPQGERSTLAPVLQ